MRLRSPRELAFRAHQQIFGIAAYLLPPPSFRGVLRGLPLPSGESARTLVVGEPYRVLAEAILRHEFLIFGEILTTGPSIDWRRDYRNGISTPVRWFRRIAYLDFASSGDHKWIWELNRHQHLVVLAQAWVLYGDRRYLEEIGSQVKEWDTQNPYLGSINWASSLELGFRAISWLWVLHLAGDALSEEVRLLFGTLLLRHGAAIAGNLSTYFAPNTHLLGEGVALHAIGLALGKTGWERQGAAIMELQLHLQVQLDGFHFEQSTYYHLYALDMFLFHYLLAGRPARYRATLERMAAIMATLTGSSGEFPFFGDDDGGRWFHPYGFRGGFAAATLATCAGLFPECGFSYSRSDNFEQMAWWTAAPPPPPVVPADLCDHFAACGLCVFRRGATLVIFDCGPFAPGSAGHSHADSLSLTVQVDGQNLLIDPGTYTYVSDAKERDWFRGTRAHNTVRLGSMDQADPVAPFRWENKPMVRRISTGNWSAAGECSYRGWIHGRTVNFRAPRLLTVEDEITGEVSVEQIWHSCLPVERISSHVFRIGMARFEVDARLNPQLEEAWCSRVFGSRERSYLLVCRGKSPFSSPLLTRIHL